MKRIILLLFCVSIILTSCKKDYNYKTYKLEGYAQKGPFLTGSNVTIIELDKDLNPTGKTFLTTIEDNTGKFSFPDVQFESSYVQIKVTGQQYSEASGGVDINNQLTLNSMVDLSTTSKININVITNMVEARLKVLVDSGISFDEAKKQAEKEVLKVFSLESYDINSSEKLDLTNDSIDGGVLLLISSIITYNIGSRMTLQEYITNLQTDFKDDGVIESAILLKTLVTSALALDPDLVISNLNNRYSEMDMKVNLYDFKPLLNLFLSKTKVQSFFDVNFPSTHYNFINLISSQDSIMIDKSLKYAIIINSPEFIDFSFIPMSFVDIEIISATSNYYISDSVSYPVVNGNVKTYQICLGSCYLYSGEIPVSFIDSGQFELKLNIVSPYYYPNLKYPTKTILWN